jgi:hypothetical protein
MGWAVSSFDLRAEVPIIFKSYWLALRIGFAKLFAATVFRAIGRGLVPRRASGLRMESRSSEGRAGVNARARPHPKRGARERAAPHAIQ